MLNRIRTWFYGKLVVWWLNKKWNGFLGKIGIHKKTQEESKWDDLYDSYGSDED